MTVCSYHVTYAFQSESTLCSQGNRCLRQARNKGQLFFRAVCAPLAPTRISYAIGRMLERLPIPLAQVKASNTSVNLLKKSGKSFSFSIDQKKSQKNYIVI